MSDQLPLVEGTQRRDLSAWYTPSDTARRIVQFAHCRDGICASGLKILEPSCGRGALVQEMVDYDPELVCGVDIDADAVSVCQVKNWGLRGQIFMCRDFLKEHFAHCFDIAIMNPPFEGGQTERHIMHALKFADRVVCHCPLTTLAGKARREGLWSEVRLLRLAICSTRPKYGADGGKTDMCTIDVMPWKALIDVGYSTDIEWWP